MSYEVDNIKVYYKYEQIKNYFPTKLLNKAINCQWFCHTRETLEALAQKAESFM